MTGEGRVPSPRRTRIQALVWVRKHAGMVPASRCTAASSMPACGSGSGTSMPLAARNRVTRWPDRLRRSPATARTSASAIGAAAPSQATSTRSTRRLVSRIFSSQDWSRASCLNSPASRRAAGVRAGRAVPGSGRQSRCGAGKSSSWAGSARCPETARVTRAWRRARDACRCGRRGSPGGQAGTGAASGTAPIHSCSLARALSGWALRTMWQNRHSPQESGRSRAQRSQQPGLARWWRAHRWHGTQVRPWRRVPSQARQ
jgi:hypothetical protein